MCIGMTVDVVGFGGSPRHDPHLLYTTSAVQLLALLDRLDLLNVDATAACRSFNGLIKLPYQVVQYRSGMSHGWTLLLSNFLLNFSQNEKLTLRFKLPLFCRSGDSRKHICGYHGSMGVHADVTGLQQPDGSFAGDEWGEIDTRSVCQARACRGYKLGASDCVSTMG